MGIPERVIGSGNVEPLSSLLRTDYEMCGGAFGEGIRFVGAKRAKKILDIRDGLSNTFCFGECQGLVINGARKQCAPYTWQAGKIINPTNPMDVDGDWLLLNPQRDSDGNLRYEASQFSSPHPDIVNFSMCDGAVRMIKQNASLQTLTALATIDNNDFGEFPLQVFVFEPVFFSLRSDFLQLSLQCSASNISLFCTRHHVRRSLAGTIFIY